MTKAGLVAIVAAQSTGSLLNQNIARHGPKFRYAIDELAEFWEQASHIGAHLKTVIQSETNRPARLPESVLPIGIRCRMQIVFVK